MIRHIALCTLAAFTSVSFGCTDADLKESDVVEKTTAEKPVLTSTTPVPPSTVEETPRVDIETEKAELRETVPQPKAVEEPAAPSFEPIVESVDGLTIRRFVTTSEIVKREPVAPGASFGTDDEKIYAFIEASNESTLDKTVIVHFIGPETTVSGGIELQVPASAPRWRTWAYTRYAKKPGLWRVEIRDLDGNLLGALPFEIQPEI